MEKILKNIEQTLDEKLTVAEVYAARPRKWVLYTVTRAIRATRTRSISLM